MRGKARKKPVVIEFVRWTGTNLSEIEDFDKFDIRIDECRPPMKPYGVVKYVVFIKTLEGTMEASVGDYIIKGVNGEIYPCKPEIFGKTYDILEAII